MFITFTWPKPVVMFDRHIHSWSLFVMILLVSLAGGGRSSYGQDISYDPTFDQGTGLGSPPFEATVSAVQVSASGHIYACGSFLQYNGVTRSGLIRLLPDGTLDVPYSSGSGAFPFVAAIGFQSDGRAIIGGRIQTFDGQPSFSLARVNLDGTLDNTFNSGVTWDVTALVVLPNDEIVACGRSSSSSSRYVHRFSANGVLDNTLNTTIDNDPWEVQVQADGKILLGGAFTTVNGVQRSRLARLNTDGSVDPSFLPPEGYLSYQVRGIAVQPDGRILVGIPYSMDARGLSRLMSDGSLDPTFITHSPELGIIEDVDVLPNGQVFISGSFTDLNGAPASNVALVNSDGTLATSTAWGPSDVVRSAAFDAQGRFIVGGNFQDCAGAVAKALCRLRPCPTGTAFLDADGDGWGNGQFPVCGAQPGYVTNQSDCNDSDPLSGLPLIWYADGDGDSWGDSFTTILSCTQPLGYVLNDDDCNDADPFVFPLAPCDDGDPLTVNDAYGAAANCECNGTQVLLTVRVLLDGNYDPNAGTMHDSLRSQGLIPLQEPYSSLGYEPAPTSYASGTSAPVERFTDAGDDSVVDWVIVELRSAADPAIPVSTRYLLLQRDGDITDLDGGTPRFPVAPGDYHVAALHRFHMGVVTLNAMTLATSVVNGPVDLSDPAVAVHGGSDARKALGVVRVLHAGDVSFNDRIQYVGSGNDRDPILLRVGGSVPTNTVSGYFQEDVNLDGIVRYAGALNDRDPVLSSIGGSTPQNIRPNTYLRSTP
jgi:uncharacterized delta-60 repeat protein